MMEWAGAQNEMFDSRNMQAMVLGMNWEGNFEVRQFAGPFTEPIPVLGSSIYDKPQWFTIQEPPEAFISISKTRTVQEALGAQFFTYQSALNNWTFKALLGTMWQWPLDVRIRFAHFLVNKPTGATPGELPF